jgi:DNA-binding MarR family transcriptional regulator
VVSESLEDTELARLLAQLLRVVNPAITAGAAQAASEAPPASASAAEGPANENSRRPALNGAAEGAALKLNGAGRPDDHHEPGPASGPSGPGLAGMSASEARALIELVAARGIAQGELGGLLGLEKSTISRLAAGLERKGWIRRGRDEDNQRYVRLYLTPQGRAVAATVLNAWQSRQARVLAALTADERAGLEAGLRGLVRGLAAERISGDSGPGGSGPGGSGPGGGAR